jgi:hypothetical protein
MALAGAGSASAAVYYDVTLTGTITSQGPGPDDANLHVGDTLTLTARFSDAYVVQNPGGVGFTLAGSWSNKHALPGIGPEFWRIDGGGLTWYSGDDIYDGASPWYESSHEQDHSLDRTLAGAGLVIQDGKVLGFDSNALLSPAGPTAPTMILPDIGGGYEVSGWATLDHSGPITSVSHLTEPTFGGGFALKNYDYYANNRYTPGFTGIWDFADSVVTIEGIPEPSTWAMMLLGFFAAGAALRHRRLTSAEACRTSLSPRA